MDIVTNLLIQFHMDINYDFFCDLWFIFEHWCDAYSVFNMLNAVL